MFKGCFGNPDNHTFSHRHRSDICVKFDLIIHSYQIDFFRLVEYVICQ